ncbi:phosphotransferase [Actinopolymorpha rutila]|uniref:Aminoglycoside phosphotransferase (APT) family kinase protein n=1 Tax=Actinopolymorpha rutila TaxID=446787 RepID=A0A852Z6K8_9ACTN|nr:phosphotransferase [Actinopolymorpha rutila]NYH87835.1 aminoglycoside phosphotransferase (APT) family kinase protein [Actinopolymorpha rutila]
MVSVVDTATSRARRLVRDLNARSGLELELVGTARHGEVSEAVFVRRPDGRDGVLTRSTAPAGFLRHLGDVLGLARERGAPVPRHELVTEVSEGAVIVQERLPGAPPTHVTAHTVDAIVAANDRLAGVLADRSDVHVPDLHLRRSGDGWCLHETLERYDDRSRRLLKWIREIGDTSPQHLSGDDLVHLDLVPGNVLFTTGEAVTGIVDWAGLGRGDRWFALLKLRFHLAFLLATRPAGGPSVEPEAIVRLDEILGRQVDPVMLRAYWAHWSLGLVDWAVRHGPPEHAEHYLDIALSHLESPETP